MKVPGPMNLNGTCLGMMVADDFHGISSVQILIMILPSGKLPKSYGKSLCLMGKSTNSMAIFTSKL